MTTGDAMGTFIPVALQEVLSLLLVRHLPAIAATFTTLLLDVIVIRIIFIGALRVHAAGTGFRLFAGGSLDGAIIRLPSTVRRLTLAVGASFTTSGPRGFSILAVCTLGEFTRVGRTRHADDGVLASTLGGRRCLLRLRHLTDVGIDVRGLAGHCKLTVAVLLSIGTRKTQQ